MAILTERTTWRRGRVRSKTRTIELTPDEMANVRRAMHVLIRRYGDGAKLARAMGSTERSVHRASGPRGKPSIMMAFRAARLGGVCLTMILTGAWPRPGSCPMCGRA